MHRVTNPFIILSAVIVFAGCSTFHEEEPGPEKTIAYYIQVQSSVPGVIIETNSVVAGPVPITLKIFGDSPGNFHNFGNPEFTVRAIPPTTNQFVQARVFRTGTVGHSGSGDKIPGVIFFDVNQQKAPMLIDSYPTQ
jgi:hypothetical protein